MPAPAVAPVCAVDQDEGAGLAVLGIGIERDRLGGGEIAIADIVDGERRDRGMLAGLDIGAVFQRSDGGGDRMRADAQRIGAARQHRIVVQPHQMGGELVGDFGPRIGGSEDVAASDIDLIGKFDGCGLSGFDAFDRSDG